jgi:hypothetical protein
MFPAVAAGETEFKFFLYFIIRQVTERKAFPAEVLS